MEFFLKKQISLFLRSRNTGYWNTEQLAAVRKLVWNSVTYGDIIKSLKTYFLNLQNFKANTNSLVFLYILDCVFPSKDLFFWQKIWKKKGNSSATICWYGIHSMSRCTWCMWKSDRVCCFCYLLLLLSKDIQGKESKRFWSLLLGSVDTASTSPVCLYCIYCLFLLEKTNMGIFWYMYVTDWWTWSIHRKHPKSPKQVNMLQQKSPVAGKAPENMVCKYRR